VSRSQGAEEGVWKITNYVIRAVKSRRQDEQVIQHTWGNKKYIQNFGWKTSRGNTVVRRKHREDDLVGEL
jgi:hypothetical protein